MQVSRRQAARALDAMRRTQRRASARRRRTRGRPAVAVRPWTMDLVLRRIADLPDTRVEVVADARSRHARGERVPAEAIADAALRRASCDRLR